MAKVLMAMSGGVDSSVAALLLKEQGHDVVGITMKLLDMAPADAVSCKACCGYDASRDAKMVAESIGIPHYMINAVDIFKETVIDDFVAEYKAGRTPNPCVRCNQFVKFDFLMTKANELDCEFVATGHYAVREGKYLYKGVDAKKDQAYFLYVIYNSEIERILFPLGKMTKDEIRHIAAEKGLVTAQKPESQDICFVQDGNYAALLESDARFTEGNIVDKSGKVVGRHSGIHRYTIGQRKGLGAYGAKMFVTQIVAKDNAVVIGTEDDLLTNDVLVSNLITAQDFTFESGKEYGAQVRYRSKPSACFVDKLDDGTLKLRFVEPVRAVASGQSAVIFENELVIGGGIIL